ncbi:hypothetical protein AVEN_122377-1 [Araneus ventricosus]|uniref:Uncharacterized protein n=1 Tax=Araneus ventricosus TaxID=182803 RepID=A0A4Y1ZRS7_ARAVE|nr:hypothetical protein AVEN_122377-1 [Araneus ventricosus]
MFVGASGRGAITNGVGCQGPPQFVHGVDRRASSWICHEGCQSTSVAPEDHQNENPPGADEEADAVPVRGWGWSPWRMKE